MKWHKVDKTKSEQPTSGSYQNWKPRLAAEGKYQCVYCAIPESSFGGTRNFHVEHHKPKSIFGWLKNDIGNQFYSCAICNTFKGDDWPCEPSQELDFVCYANPSLTDYNEIFEVQTSGQVNGRNVAARYMIEQLFLNRPQLLHERRQANLTQELQQLKERISKQAILLQALEDRSSRTLLGDIVQVLGKATNLLITLRDVIPYTEEDVRR